MTVPLLRKSSGKLEEYDPNKVLASLARAGLSLADAEAVLERISGGITDGMTTRQLHKLIRKTLRQVKRGAYYRYDLKRAIERLGPAGYPFEDFVMRIFKAHGYHCEVRQIVAGKCAPHELDLVYERTGEEGERGARGFAECKFRPGTNRIISIKEALYVYGRLDDLKRGSSGIEEGWLVTNARFTSEVTAYGECAGLKLLAWNWPPGRGIERMIEEFQLYPVTVLGGLSKSVWEELYRHRIVLVSELLATSDELGKAGVLPREIHERLVREAEYVMHNHEKQ